MFKVMLFLAILGVLWLWLKDDENGYR